MASAILRLSSRWSRDEKRGYAVRAIRILRRLLIAAGWNPPCRIALSGCSWSLLMPFSHELPTYWNRFPTYDRLPLRVARTLRAEHGFLSMVDVGANVGDTVRLTEPEVGDQYLAIEPHPAFFKYATSNLSAFPNVTCLCVACGSSAGRIVLSEERRGTAGRGEITKGPSVELLTLDELLEKRVLNAPVTFIKIDTDGYDLDVINGAWRTIERDRPVLLVECDVHLSGGAVAPWLAACLRLFEYGYFCVDVFDNFGGTVGRFSLTEYADLGKVLEARGAGVSYCDLLFIPSRAVATRLSELS